MSKQNIEKFREVILKLDNKLIQYSSTSFYKIFPIGRNRFHGARLDPQYRCFRY